MSEQDSSILNPDTLERLKKGIGFYWDMLGEYAEKRVVPYGDASVTDVKYAFGLTAAKIETLFNIYDNKQKYPDKPIEWVVGRSIWQTVFSGVFSTIGAAAGEYVGLGPLAAAALSDYGSDFGGLGWDEATAATQPVLRTGVEQIRAAYESMSAREYIDEGPVPPIFLGSGLITSS